MVGWHLAVEEGLRGEVEQLREGEGPPRGGEGSARCPCRVQRAWKGPGWGSRAAVMGPAAVEAGTRALDCYLVSLPLSHRTEEWL